MQFVRLLHNLQGVFRSIGGYAQKWTEDESATTSLGRSIPVDNCGIEMSLVSQEELPYMHTLEDNCGIEMGLISIEEITQ